MRTERPIHRIISMGITTVTVGTMTVIIGHIPNTLRS